jgi:TonB family protein
MLMMTKERTASIANIKLIVVVPVVTVVFLAVSAYREIPSSTASNQKSIAIIEKAKSSILDYATLPPPPPPPPPPAEENYDPFVVVEEMPMFPGGDEALLNFIGAKTIYPEAAMNQNIQGKVIIRFCVSPKGKVVMASVLKGVSPELDTEALRVVNTLPKFIPGKQGGEPVPVWFMVPIAFTLK